MKRKIAILLSAMMVTSAMPMTASAAQLKGDTVLNAAFPKADKTIDPNYSSISYKKGESLTASQLKDRQSVLKINLINDGTAGNIPAGSTFKITLENGKFDKDKGQFYQYVNTNNGKVVTYDEAIKSASTLTQVFENIVSTNYEKPEYGWQSTSTTPTNITSGQNGSVLTQIDRVQKVVNGAKTSFNPIGNDSPNATYKIKINGEKVVITDGVAVDGNQDGTVLFEQDMTNDNGSGYIKIFNLINDTNYANVDFLKLQMQKEYIEQESGRNREVELPHIPYYLTIDNDTTATVTLPVEITDKDKKVSIINNATKRFTKGTSETLIGDMNGTTNKYSVAKIKSSNQATLGTTEDVNSGATTTTADTYIAIPLGAVIADSDEPIKVSVDGGYTDKVISGSYSVTKDDLKGSTQLVFPTSSIRRFDENVMLEPIIIRENVRNTIGKTNKKDTAEVIVRLSGGFKFKNTKAEIEATDRPAKDYKFIKDNSNNVVGWNNGTTKISAEMVNDSTIKFTLKGLGGNRNRPIGFSFEGLQVEPINDKNFGDVTFNVSGDGINSQSTVVAKREQLGFKLETTKDPKDIIVGRHYVPNNFGFGGTDGDIKTNGTKKNGTMLEENNKTVEIKFSEAIPNTLVTSRSLDFNLPEGVKLVDADIYDTKNFTGLDEKDFEIINNGRTLRLNGAKKGEYTVPNRDNKVAEFKMTLDLSVAPSFTGDIKLGVTGGGESKTVETVIAKAKQPFEVKTTTTKANLGYQDYNTADITITETAPGMFLENKDVVLKLIAPYGTSELGFSDAKFEISGGELQVKNSDFKVGSYGTDKDKKDGAITFRVDRASYKNPSTITIKDVKVGTTRSVPFGSYDLSLAGDAVINNYASKIKDTDKYNLETTLQAETNGSDRAKLYMQNNNDAFIVKDYVNVITEPGTFDQVVKVSVGEKTILLGDQAIDMDVAPYIQASSNSTMVPLRFVSVALGVDTANASNADQSSKIAFDTNTKTTTIYYGAGTGQKIIQFQAGSNIMTVDGTRIPMEFGVKAEIKDGRMFVPFRALGQALGVTVDWDADTRTAIYNKEHGRNYKMMETTTETTTAAASTTESTTASDTTTETTTAAKN